MQNEDCCLEESTSDSSDRLLQRGSTELSCSVVSTSATPWTVAHQAPLSMGLSRQEYWSRSLCPSPGDLPNLGIEPVSPAWQADSLPLNHLGSPANFLGRCQFVSPFIYCWLCWVSVATRAFSISAASLVKYRLQGMQPNSYCTQA